MPDIQFDPVLTKEDFVRLTCAADRGANNLPGWQFMDDMEVWAFEMGRREFDWVRENP